MLRQCFGLKERTILPNFEVLNAVHIGIEVFLISRLIVYEIRYCEVKKKRR